MLFEPKKPNRLPVVATPKMNENEFCPRGDVLHVLVKQKVLADSAWGA